MHSTEFEKTKKPENPEGFEEIEKEIKAQAAISAEDDLLALRGGLRGRMAEEFTVLQCTLEALRRHIRSSQTPAVTDTAERLFCEVDARLASVRRLADNAAELAATNALRGMRDKTLVELQGYLRTLTACAAEELRGCGSSLRVELEETPGAPTCWAVADRGMMGALLANLISNSASQAGCTRAVMRCTADRRLIYTDDGPGLPERAVSLLMNGQTGGAIDTGETGLLLVRGYAAALGWQVEAKAGEIAFSLPPLPPDAAAAAAAMRTNRMDRANTAQLRAALHRELAALRLKLPAQQP